LPFRSGPLKNQKEEGQLDGTQEVVVVEAEGEEEEEEVEEEPLLKLVKLSMYD